MTRFEGNMTLSLMGEQWATRVREFAEQVDIPEADMLAERLSANLNGEVEDRLTAVVYATVLEDLAGRLDKLESRVHELEAAK